MDFALEFPDSELRDVVADPAGVRVRLSAASVRDARGEHGWLAGVVLTLAGASINGDAAHAFGKIAEGRLRHDGVALPRLALPATLAGAIELSLRLANGTTLSLRAASLTAATDPGAVFTPDLSC